MNAPIIPPTVLLGLNGDNGLRAQRKRRNPFPPHQAATSAAEAAKATRKVSGHNIKRWAKDQQIHTEPKPVNAVRLPPCSTSPLSTEGCEQANTTIGARPNSDGRSHAANGYRTANPSNTTVSTLLSFTRRTYSITATTATAAANAAVGPRPVQTGMPTTGAMRSQVVHFSINSRLRDTSTAIPPIARIAHEEHGAGVQMDVQWTQVDVERHAPIEVNDSHVVVEHQRSPVSSWFGPANHAPLDDVESASASRQTVQGQDRPRPAAPGT
jgi:hypothetical protein